MVTELKATLMIPVAAKLSPFFTAFGNLADELEHAGVDGLVLFNRFYQPDIDIDTLATVPNVALSTSAELLLRLRWLAILHGRVHASLAVTGGVAEPADGIKAILAGADAVQSIVGVLAARRIAHFRDARWLGRMDGQATLGDACRGPWTSSAWSCGLTRRRSSAARYIRMLQAWSHPEKRQA